MRPRPGLHARALLLLLLSVPLGACAGDEPGGVRDAGSSDALVDAAMPGDASDASDATSDGAMVIGGDVGVGRLDAGIVTAMICPQHGVIGAGRHRLFVQGRGAPPRPDGTWPLLHERPSGGGDAILCDDRVFVDDLNGDGVWQPGEEPHGLGPSELVHGEHFLVGPGSFVEFTTTLCADITGNVALYIPNFDVEGSVALHQLLVLDSEGREQLIAEVTDDEPGTFGYNPFVRVVEGVDPVAHAGDTLMLRSINISGLDFSVMVWRPPSEYESWVLVEVPE